MLERYAASLGTNKTAALRALLRERLAEQEWQAGAQDRYRKVMEWLKPRFAHPKPPVPKAAFDDLYGYIEESESC